MLSLLCTFILSLFLFTSASPIFKDPGVYFPVHKRTSLTKADGTFDHHQAIIQSARTYRKHRQNMANFQHNLGLQLAVDSTTPHPSIGKRQSEPLTDEDNGSEWAGPLSIGVPRQGFTIDFDTGSSDLWVPSSDCTTSVCSSKNKYSPQNSVSSQEQSGTFFIEYGDSSNVSGLIYTDTVSAAGVTVTNQYLSAVTSLSDEFADAPFDGILGLAFQSISNLNQTPYLQHAYEQGVIPAAMFSFKIATTDSSLFLGGTDSHLYSGSIESHPLSSTVGYWQIGGASALVDGITAFDGFQTIIDSGTTIMYGPPLEVAAFYLAVPGAFLWDLENGFYAFPCTNPPSIAFSWGGEAWTVSQENFSLGQTQSNSSLCVGALAAKDLGFGPLIWLLGDSFMTNVYTVFSFEENTVGFAHLS